MTDNDSTPDGYDLKRRRLLQTIGASAGASIVSVGPAASASDDGTTDENTIAFDQLSDAGKEAFETAVSAGEHSTEASLPKLNRHEYVAYQNTTYAINRITADVQKHVIRPERIPADTAPYGATARSYANLSDEGRELFEAAVETGTYVSDGATPPDVFDLDDEYVEYDGEWYQLNFAQTMYFVTTIAPEAV